MLVDSKHHGHATTGLEIVEKRRELLSAGSGNHHLHRQIAAIAAGPIADAFTTHAGIMASYYFQNRLGKILGVLPHHLDRVIAGKLDTGRLLLPTGIMFHNAIDSLEQGKEEKMQPVHQTLEQTTALDIVHGHYRPIIKHLISDADLQLAQGLASADRRLDGVINRELTYQAVGLATRQGNSQRRIDADLYG